MKTAPRDVMVGMLIAALGAVFFALPAEAQTLSTIISSQPFATVANTSATETHLGTGLSGQAGTFVGAGVAAAAFNIKYRVTCFTSNTYASECGGAGAGEYNYTIDTASVTVDGAVHYYSQGSWDRVLTFDATKYYGIDFVGSNFTTYGTSTAGASRAYTIYAAAPDTSIDWSAYYTPLVYSSTTAGIATSSSLWGSLSLASSTVQCDTGNVFTDALCNAGTFLFVPNADILSAYASLPDTIGTKFPFSWVVGVRASFSGLTSTSTTQMMTLTLPFHTVGVGTSSVLGLANVVSVDPVGFSTSTIEQYIGASNWAVFQSLIALAIWLGFAADVFFTTRNQLARGH